MSNTERFYVLWHIQSSTYLRADVSSTGPDADFCGDTVTTLRAGEKSPARAWKAGSPEHAEYVRLNSTPWYNASCETPEHSLDFKELKVVAVELTVRHEPVPVTIPTVTQFYTTKFGPKGWEPNKQHLQWVLDDLEMARYDYHDLQEYLKHTKHE